VLEKIFVIITDMKNQLAFILGGILLVIVGIFFINYEGKPQAPIIEKDGKIEGNYSIESIMSLDKPYKCTLEKNDENSKIVGLVLTDGKKIYGEFRIKTDLIEKEFNSFLIMKDNKSYTWTSLENIGLEYPAVKSASKNASPQEQIQIIGLKDKILYKCEPWPQIDDSNFEVPSWITFSEFKK